MARDATAIAIQGPDSLSGNPLPTYNAPIGVTGGVPAFKGSTNTQANAACNVSLTAEVGRTNFLTQIIVTATGATAASELDVNITNLVGGTLHMAFVIPVGALVQATPLVIQFIPPIPATGTNVAINGNMGAAGAGNTQQTMALYGYSM
jgi:hypothetical protein